MLKIAAQNTTSCIRACAGNFTAATLKSINFSQSLNHCKKHEIKSIADFETNVIKSSKPIVVNFHAEWCDPCKILTPKMISMLENSKDVDLAVVNVEENPDLVETFEVKAVPAILAFHKGVVIDKFIGLTNIEKIEAMIERLKTQK